MKTVAQTQHGSRTGKLAHASSKTTAIAVQVDDIHKRPAVFPPPDASTPLIHLRDLVLMNERKLSRRAVYIS